MGFGIMELLFSLIVLGLGYIVLYLAGKSESGMQGLGKLIGRVMVIISAATAILALFLFTTVMVRSVIGNRPQLSVQEHAAKPIAAPRASVR